MTGNLGLLEAVTGLDVNVDVLHGDQDLRRGDEI